jgi:hypothetical protein
MAGKRLHDGEFCIIGGERLRCAAGRGPTNRPACRPTAWRRPAPCATNAHYDRVVPDCLFCGIAAGQIPAAIVLDGKRAIAFRDISPQAPTYVLVVPRDHFPNVAAVR